MSPDDGALCVAPSPPGFRPRDHARVTDRAAAKLRTEAVTLGRFIVGRPIEVEFVDRYVAAHTHLAMEARQQGDDAVVNFAMAHPVLLPPLDAAAALVRPQSLLHKKALLMSAILEASPAYAAEFLPRQAGWIGLLGLIAHVGVVTICQLLIGVPLLTIVGRRT